VHKPVLIDVPPTALGAWIKDQKLFQEANSLRNIQLRTFCTLGGPNSSHAEQNRAIKGGLNGLRSFFSSVNREDPQTSRIAVLTTFQSFCNEVLDTRGASKKRDTKAGRPRELRACREDNKNTEGKGRGEGEGEDEDDNVDMSEGEGWDRVGEEEEEGKEGEEGEDEEGEEEEDEEEEDVVNEVESEPEDDEDEGNGPVGEGATPASVSGNKLLIPADSVGLVVVDEGHKIKNENANQTDALYRLDCPIIIMTATPFKTHVRDFYGLLRFMWKGARAIANPKLRLSVSTHIAWKKTFTEEYGSSLIGLAKPETEAVYRDLLAALNPLQFKKLCSHTSTASGDVAPLPQSMVVLRRVGGDEIDVNGTSVVIGSEIPHVVPTTIEVRRGPFENRLYQQIVDNTKSMNQDPIVVVDTDEESSFTPGGLLKRRRLIHGTFHPLLDQFFDRKIDGGATAIHKL
jgi:hypothetical protein